MEETATKTPRQVTKELRERLQKVKTRLPKVWIPVFVHKYPQYAEMLPHLNNVSAGNSLDIAVICKMEDFANMISPE